MSHLLKLRGLLLPCLITAASGVISADDASPDSRSEFLEKYCVDCHTGNEAEVGFRIDELKAPGASDSAFSEWSTLYRRVSLGEMPPADADMPSDAVRKQFSDGLHEKLAELQTLDFRANGRASLRRLNSAEYQNLLRDVLKAPHVSISGMLPPENSHDGFDKSAEALEFSHVHAQRIVDAADAALRKAIVEVVEMPESKVQRFVFNGAMGEDELRNGCQGIFAALRQGVAIPMNGTSVDTSVVQKRTDSNSDQSDVFEDRKPFFDGVAFFQHSEINSDFSIQPFDVPVSGWYTLRARGFGVTNDEGQLVDNGRIETLAFYDANGLLGRIDLPTLRPTTREVRVWLDKGDQIKLAAATSRDNRYPIETQNLRRYELFKSHGVAVQWVELQGPHIDLWPPASHRVLFETLPVVGSVVDTGDGTSSVQVTDIAVEKSEQSEIAKRLLRRFYRRATRQDPTDTQFQLAWNQYEQRIESGATFMESMLAGYRSILAAPETLLVHEATGQLSHEELATRLSLFLWDAPPDLALIRRVGSGALETSDGLSAIVETMLEDPRSGRFRNHFLNHWLQLGWFEVTTPDDNLYPGFTPLLKESMNQEPRLYFKEMVSKDLNASHVVASDFTMLNQKLAELYGIEGVSGSSMRKVQLPEDSVRGGFLTHGAVMKVTSNGTTTSPVYRGLYVMGQLLGDPPPPPPPVVPAVEPDISGATTIREQLARHRADPSCSSCHAKIDPAGFALESFDVMGEFRDRYRSTGKGELIGILVHGIPSPSIRESQKVDPSGVMPDGTRFSDIRGLRNILLTRERQIARNLLSQLVAFATGRAPSFADEPEVEMILDRLEPEGFGVRSMIHEVARSRMFQHK